MSYDNEEMPNNTAETMRQTMETYMPHFTIDVPDPTDVMVQAHLLDMSDGRKVVDLTKQIRDAAEYLKPARRKGTAHMEDLQSIVGWANRFKGDTSALFAKPDMDAPTLTCIADYHAGGPVDPITPEGDATARHGHHRAVYRFPLSQEWKAWMGVSGQPLEKDDMGEFVEANAKDIMDPTPAVLAGNENDKNADWENRLILTARQIEGRFGQLAQLLALSRQFQIFETSDLKVVTNRDTGEGQVQFYNEHKTADGQPLKIPNLIIIAIPVFMGGAPYRMPVRLRYRKSGASVKFILSIYNPEKAFEAAFKEACAEAQKGTDLPIFLGTPEI